MAVLERDLPRTGPATMEDFWTNVHRTFMDPNTYHPPGAPIPEDQRQFGFVKPSAAKAEIAGLPFFNMASNQ
jgi:hypothetical protein